MKNLYQTSLGLIGALALTGAAFGQVPSGNDKSDASANTGGGFHALDGPAATASGEGNTGYGYQVLLPNSGSFNTASGAFALSSNTDGRENTVSGYNGLGFNTSGSYNTAAGFDVMYSNTTGGYNTALGYEALYSNNGSSNTASGENALYSNTSGSDNTASGQGALKSNTIGNSNIAMGFQAGFNLTTGSSNIDIGNLGVAGESGTIRIGTAPTQTAAFIAGISSSKVTGSAVYVTSAGQLGVLASSERYKTAIAPMGSDTAKLVQLRPVSFKLKSDATGTRQYGLIAEEVAKVYPELVIRDQVGRIDGVRYDELAPMLLNEVQQEQQKIAAQASEIRYLRQQIQLTARAAQLRNVQHEMAEMRAALIRLQAAGEYVVQR